MLVFGGAFFYPFYYLGEPLVVAVSLEVIVCAKADKAVGMLMTGAVPDYHHGGIDALCPAYLKKVAEFIMADTGADKYQMRLDGLNHLPSVIRIIRRKQPLCKGTGEPLNSGVLTNYEDIFQGHTNLTLRSNTTVWWTIFYMWLNSA